MPDENVEFLDQVPPELEVLASMGAINLTWAQIDAIASMSLYSQLQLDPFEFSILMGRLETAPKLRKLAKILEHRKEHTLAKIARYAAKTLEAEKSLRNALTHGYYLGKTKNKYCFTVPADVITEENQPSAVRFVPVTRDELISHQKSVQEIAKQLLSSFESPKLRELSSLPARVPSKN